MKRVWEKKVKIVKYDITLQSVMCVCLCDFMAVLQFSA